jgi:hypothetical protein
MPPAIVSTMRRPLRVMVGTTFAVGLVAPATSD